MTDNADAIRDDIAYVKSMVDQGRGGPLYGGAILVTAGLVYGAASLAHWAVAAEVLRVGPVAYGVIWGAAVAVFLAALMVVSAQLKARPGGMSASNQGMGAIWGGIGLACFALGLSFLVLSLRYGGQMLGILFPPVIMALYGAAWWAAGEISGRRWLQGVAWAAFVTAPVLAWLSERPEQYLAYAAALLALTAAPGWVLMRGETPKS